MRLGVRLGMGEGLEVSVAGQVGECVQDWLAGAWSREEGRGCLVVAREGLGARVCASACGARALRLAARLAARPRRGGRRARLIPSQNPTLAFPPAGCTIPGYKDKIGKPFIKKMLSRWGGGAVCAGRQRVMPHIKVGAGGAGPGSLWDKGSRRRADGRGGASSRSGTCKRHPPTNAAAGAPPLRPRRCCS